MASRAEWASRVEQWRASRLTAGEFAARAGLSERSLVWWRWKLKSTPAASPTSIAGAFLPVHVIDAEAAEAAPASAPEAFEIALPNGRVIRVPPKFDAQTLERILAIVERGGQ